MKRYSLLLSGSYYNFIKCIIQIFQQRLSQRDKRSRQDDLLII